MNLPLDQLHQVQLYQQEHSPSQTGHSLHHNQAQILNDNHQKNNQL